MIDRYTRPEMGAVWTDEARFRSWLKVELAVCEALAARGKIPPHDMRIIREKADFDISRIDRIEAEVKHDVIAFLTSVAEFVGQPARHIHFGLTSSDVLDTAQGLRMVRSVDILIEGVERLKEVAERQAKAHRHTIMVGRTHGIHAEPYTLGLKFVSWHAEAERNLLRLRTARKEIGVGKISGAVGTYAHLGPDIEADVMERLGLSAEKISTQVVPRDRYAALMSSLALLASSLDRIGTEIRHLQRSDVREVEEPFAKGQKGSSAMPHKRNPVGCENICGLARIVRSNLQTALENIALWHERDISHSSTERVVLPDSIILCDYMLHRMTGILDGLHVYPERMQENMAITKGLVFSQTVLLALTEAGMSRDDAYKVVQSNAMEAWKGEGSFKDLLARDDTVIRVLGRKGLDRLFDPAMLLRRVDAIYQRVFNK